MYFRCLQAEDLSYASKIKAKNALESATYNMRNSLQESKITAKLSAEDVSTLRGVVAETTKWIDLHANEPGTTREEFDEKLKNMEKVCGPVWTRYQKAEKEASAGKEVSADDD